MTFAHYKDDIVNLMKSINKELHFQELQENPRELDQIRRVQRKIGRVNVQADEIEPFYCWQCVSLCLSNRTIDFAITNEEHLFSFLNLLQNAVKKKIDEKNMRRLEDELKNVYRQMKVKMKIAYGALLHGQSVSEYIINAILKSFCYNLESKEHHSLDDSMFQWRSVFNHSQGGYRSQERLYSKESQKDLFKYPHESADTVKEQDDQFLIRVKPLPSLFNKNRQAENKIVVQDSLSSDSDATVKEFGSNKSSFIDINQHDQDNLQEEDQKQITADDNAPFIFNGTEFKILNAYNSVETQVLGLQKDNMITYHTQHQPQCQEADETEYQVLSRSPRIIMTSINKSHSTNNVFHLQPSNKRNQYMRQVTQDTQEHLISKLDQLIQIQEHKLQGKADEPNAAQILKESTIKQIKSTALIQSQCPSRTEESKALIKAKLRELEKLDIMFKLITKVRFDMKEDIKNQNSSPSFKFYETSEVANFKKIGDFRAMLQENVFGYLQQVRDQITHLKDQKAFILRKGMIVLQRKQEEQLEYIQMKKDMENHKEEEIKGLLNRLIVCTRKLKRSKPKSVSGYRKSEFINVKEFANLSKDKNSQHSGSANKSNVPIKKIRTFQQALDSQVNQIRDEEDLRIEQLRLKQLMNLKARGFYLDQANELHQKEYQQEQELQETQSLSKKQLSTIPVSRQIIQERKKLQSVKTQVQATAEKEFSEFREKYKNASKSGHKQKILSEVLSKEQQYFNPILNKLCQMRLVKSLHKNVEMQREKKLQASKTRRNAIVGSKDK